MNILFDIGHPAHAHLFKNFIKYLQRNSHSVIVTTRSKDVTNDILNHMEIPHLSLSYPAKGMLSMLKELVLRDIAIYKLHKKYKFDVAYGTSLSIAHLSLISKVKSYNFNEDDDDVVPAYTYLTNPFTSKIVNPECIKYKKWKHKRILYNSYHELAYLHPDNFIPNVKIIEKYKLKPGKYIVVRNSALDAHHDAGVKGLRGNVWDKVYKLIKAYPLVFSKENEKSHQIEPWDMHHILAFAKMVISDSQTMTAEAAVLGIPAIRYNSFVGKISYLEELEHKYQLTLGFRPSQEADMISKIKSLLLQPKLAEEWEKKRKHMLAEKIDLNAWMIDLFENEINIKNSK